jgi:hypothetical protein
MTREQNERNVAVGKARAQALLDQLRDTTKQATLEWAECGASPPEVGAAAMAALHKYVLDTIGLVNTLMPSFSQQAVLIKLCEDLQRALDCAPHQQPGWQTHAHEDAQTYEVEIPARNDVLEADEVDRMHAALEDVEWEGDEEGVQVHVQARPGQVLRVRRDARGVMVGVVAEPQARCPDCDAPVSSVFDHVDKDCLKGAGDDAS